MFLEWSVPIKICMKNQNIFGTKPNNKKMCEEEFLRFMKKVDYMLYDTFSFATVF